jgi:hypothetical protein
MNDMRNLVLRSFRLGAPGGGVPRRRFLLDPRARQEPTRFEVDLVLGGVRHEYGLTVDDQRVLSEWAVRYPRGRAALLFERTGDQVELGSGHRTVGQAVKTLLRPNALFLSTAASAAHPDLTPLFQWFERNMQLADAHSRALRQSLTTRLLDDEAGRTRVLEFLRAADLGITGARRKERDPAMRERMQRVARILLRPDLVHREAQRRQHPPVSALRPRPAQGGGDHPPLPRRPLRRGAHPVAGGLRSRHRTAHLGTDHMVSRGRGGAPRRTPSARSVRLSLLVFAEGVATERQYVATARPGGRVPAATFGG